MKYRKIPKTGIQISEIGFGCMSLDLSKSDNEALLREAVDLGVNYFDTADLYDKGANETLVGRALKPVRKDVIIATKVGNQWLADGSGWQWNPRKDYIINAVDKSLQRLQTDFIDLYQLHGGTIEDQRDEIIEAFELLQKSGKIRSYGISSIRPNVIKSFANESEIVSDMLQYNLLDRRPEEEILDFLQSQNVGIMVRGALAKGLLAGKPATDYMDRDQSQVQAVQETLQNLTSAKRATGQVAIRYVLGHPAVTSAVIGIRTTKQLQEAVEAGNLDELSTQELQTLRGKLAPNRYTQHL